MDDLMGLRARREVEKWLLFSALIVFLQIHRSIAPLLQS
jgi:hypothetical protein